MSQCAQCGGRGLGLVAAGQTRCAHCQRAESQPAAAQGPVHAAAAALWTRHHLAQLPPGQWSSMGGTPCATRVLALCAGLDADSCVRLAAEHGLVAKPVLRSQCTCALTAGLWTWLRGCACPTETWIEYTRPGLA